MKTYIGLFLAAAFFSACSNTQPSAPGNAQSPASPQSTTAKTQGSPSAASESTGAAPVEFFYGGITPDKTSISYKIKVNTDKPIEEVHLALKETDAGGR